MSGRTVFVGNATQDTAFFVPRLPVQDEVSPAVRKVACLGGRGVVPALVAGALGIRTELCTVIGGDLRHVFGPFLSENRVSITGVKWDDTASGTTQYVGFLTSDGRSSMAVALRPELDWSPADDQLRLIREAAAGYFSTNNLSFNRALLEAFPLGNLMIHNLGIRLDADSTYLDSVLSKATIIIGNRVEVEYIQQVTGLTPQLMLNQGRVLNAVIVTAGSAGVQVFRRNAAPQLFSALPVRELCSPVGAGDSFAVGILYSLQQGLGLDEAVQLGMKLAALALESERSYPDLRRVRDLAA